MQVVICVSFPDPSFSPVLPPIFHFSSTYFPVSYDEVDFPHNLNIQITSGSPRPDLDHIMPAYIIEIDTRPFIEGLHEVLTSQHNPHAFRPVIIFAIYGEGH